MYQWTHVELARQQFNGPIKECVQGQCEEDKSNKIDEHDQIHDTNVQKLFVERFTQTENKVDLDSNEKRPSIPPPPPPPPPPPLPPSPPTELIHKPAEDQTNTPENTSAQIAPQPKNLNTTILSSSSSNVTVLSSNASSFCVPPAPPIGIPGPPPLPLPPNGSGNMWFRSDSK